MPKLGKSHSALLGGLLLAVPIVFWNALPSDAQFDAFRIVGYMDSTEREKYLVFTYGEDAAAQAFVSEMKKDSFARQLKDVDEFWLEIPYADPELIRAFGRLPRLKTIRLGNGPDSVRIDKRGFQELARLVSVENLVFELKDGTEYDWDALSQMPGLRTLSFDSNGSRELSPDDLQGIGKLSQLRELSIRPHILAEDFSWVSGLKNLEWIALDPADKSAEFLKEAAKLPRLKELYLGDTYLGEAAIAELNRGFRGKLNTLVITTDRTSFEKLETFQGLEWLTVIFHKPTDWDSTLLTPFPDLKNLCVIGATNANDPEEKLIGDRELEYVGFD